MTNLVYVHSEFKLYYGFGDSGARKTIGARSGPHGKGVAPAGAYLVKKPIILSSTQENIPYTDAKSFAWFAKLSPLFITERSGFGIHPDGNVPGTLGCIGITEPDTRPFYDWLRAAPNAMLLQVVT